MPRASELRTNFTAGELSLLVNARTQFARYYNGSEIVENWDILTQGPLFRRKGFKFIGETKDSTKKSILIPFEFSAVQTYAIELGEGYCRFLSGQGRILDNSTTITGATNANPVVITDTAHPYSNGDEVIIQGVGGMIELNAKKFTLANATANTYELQGIDGAGFGVYTSGGTTFKIHEIANPYLESELLDIRFVQDSDVLYMAHPNHPLQKLIRLTANVFTLSSSELIKGPYLEENVVSTDLVTISGGAPWTEGSTLTLTASGGHTPFTANHVDGLWRVKTGTDIAHLKITGFTSSTVVTVIAQNDVPASLQSVAVFGWSEGEFSDARSYAGAIAFHEQRLVLAGSINSPQKIWFSKSNADYENFEVGTNADDPFVVRVASQRGDPIRWLFSDNVLFAGSVSGVFRIVSSKNSSALAPDDIDIKKHISYGCSSVQPELVGETPIYIQKGGLIARGIAFSLDADKYKATDLTVDSDQITGNGIISFEYQQTPISSLWAVRKDGQLAKLTLESDQEVQGWHRYTTQGYFESIAIISDAEESDEIYVIAQRTINGVTKRFIEVQEPNYLVDNLNRFYVDSGLTYNGTRTATLTLSGASGSIMITSDIPIFVASDVGKELHELPEFGNGGRALITAFTDSQTITVSIIEGFTLSTLFPNEWAIAISNVSGLDHLIGESVSINSDGATVPDQIVDINGNIDIVSAGSIIHIGLPYTSRQKNMPMESVSLSGAIGASQHKEKRIDRVVISFQESAGGKITSSSDTIPITARSTNNNMNQAPPLFTGNREVTVGTGWDRSGQIEIIQDGPQPMTVKSITYKITVNDK